MTVEGEKRQVLVKDAPAENFAHGIFTVDLPSEFGPKTSGKVRDIWQRDGSRVMVTTDRQSAFDRLICTVPLKGLVLNLMSAWWFEKTEDIVPNHFIDAYKNVLIARQAADVIPVEIVWREYMARSATSTSVYRGYINEGRRTIYGIDFPDGVKPNERFPMGPILTPTTKADEGHDLELDEERAREIVDRIGGEGTWEKIREASRQLFEYGSRVLRENRLILVDTKYEFGIDKNGELMLIDEIHTPDSSRIWKADSYQERFEKGETPETFDKEILRRWLSGHGFRGEGLVPVVDPDIINQMRDAYLKPFVALTGVDLIGDLSESEIREAVIQYFRGIDSLFSG